MTDEAPTAPPGWYDVSGGGKRFWNGISWTPDVLGAPSATAEFDALSPTLPAPTVPLGASGYGVAIAPPTSAVPAGWYTNPAGALQWWDGDRWGQLSAPTTIVVRAPKETGIAYLFFFLLGTFAAHRFYLGRTGSAIAFLIIWWLGWILTPVLIGIPLVIAGFVWLFVDLFLIPSLTRGANAARGYVG